MRTILLFMLLSITPLSFADNRSDQMNPNNDAYWQSRGYDERPDNWEDRSSENSYSYSQHEYDNRSNQLNPNNDAYWQSRGYDGRPYTWDDNWDDTLPENTNSYSQHEYDNRSNQLNPNNDVYWKSRGYSEKPDNTENSGDSWSSSLRLFKVLIHFLAVR